MDFFLFDTKTKEHGGSGKTFNWEILDKYSLDPPFFLSGGIGMEQLDELDKIRNPRLHALDVNSQFEISPGLKDVASLKKLIGHLDSKENELPS